MGEGRGEKLGKPTAREAANFSRKIKRERVFHFARPFPQIPPSDQLPQAIRLAWEKLEAMNPSPEDRRVFDVLYNYAFGLNRLFAELSLEKLARTAAVSTASAVASVEKLKNAAVLIGKRKKIGAGHIDCTLLH